MNKSDLVRAVADREQITISQVERIIDTFLDIISLALACEEPCSLRNFGKFDVRSRSATKRRNPKTGEMVHLPARRGVGFRPAPALKERVNGRR